MLLLLAVLLILPFGSLSANLPGEPWSKGEVARTKERLWNIMNNPGKFVKKNKKAKENGACNKDCWEGCDDFKATGPHDYCVHCDDTTCTNCQCCRGWCDQKVNNIEPTPAKFVRLAFHQCLLYTDGTGGCDGCLDWTKMGVQYGKKNEPSGNGPYDNSFDDPGDIANGDGDNNNMIMTVLALEHVFKDSNLGDNGLSLMDAKKSRADLWSLAGIVAIEYSVNENNLACTAANLPWTRRGTGARGCGRRDMDEPLGTNLDCYVDMPNIPFRTGRTDCDSGAKPYIATKKEFHPSPYANGPETLQFFVDQFGFTNERDVVALMGAHTLGKLTQSNAFFKYFWSRGEHSYFNNQYYKTMIGDTDYAIQCMDEGAGFAFIGEPNGTAGYVTWKAHGRGWFQSGGPFSWRRNLDLCYDGKIGASGLGKMLQIFEDEEEVNENCYDPSQQLVNGGPEWSCNPICRTTDDFVDEVMLNSDMGLYLDFEVDQTTGRQIGTRKDGSISCHGIVDANNLARRWARGDTGAATEANCDKSKSITATIVEDYASNQEQWVLDFADVYDRMMANGYDINQLQVAEYECCTRNPPSKANKANKGSVVTCDSSATC